MSFLIDENAIRRILEKQTGSTYTVTTSNLGGIPEPSPTQLFPSGIFSTSSVMPPHMSPETIERLLNLRQRIVASGAPLLTTKELDTEVSERKGLFLRD